MRAMIAQRTRDGIWVLLPTRTEKALYFAPNSLMLMPALIYEI